MVRNAIGPIIGNGSFGNVYRGHMVPVGDVAIKVINLEGTEEEAYLRQVTSIASISHSRIINIFGMA